MSFWSRQVLAHVAVASIQFKQGTSYTLANVEISSNTTTASNYAKDWHIAIPVRPELIHGPFLEHPDKPVPPYVLTKSHCTGYCTDCAPRKYVASLESFESGCLRVERPDSGRGGETHYDSSVPAKVVHLIRSPFDNVSFLGYRESPPR